MADEEMDDMWDDPELDLEELVEEVADNDMDDLLGDGDYNYSDEEIEEEINNDPANVGLSDAERAALFQRKRMIYKKRAFVRSGEQEFEELANRIEEAQKGVDSPEEFAEEVSRIMGGAGKIATKLMANHQAKVVELLGDKSSGKTDLYENLADVVKRYQEGSLQFNVADDKKKELNDAKNLATSPETFKKFLKDYVVKSLDMDEAAGKAIYDALEKDKDIAKSFNDAVLAEATNQLIGNVRHETLEDTKLNSVMPEEHKASSQFVTLVKLKAETSSKLNVGNANVALGKKIKDAISGVAPEVAAKNAIANKAREVITNDITDSGKFVDQIGKIIKTAEQYGVYGGQQVNDFKNLQQQVRDNGDTVVTSARMAILGGESEFLKETYTGLVNKGPSKVDISEKLGLGITDGVRDTAHFLSGGIVKARVYEAEKSENQAGFVRVFDAGGAAKQVNKTLKNAGQPELDKKALDYQAEDATKLSNAQKREYKEAQQGRYTGGRLPFRSKKIRRTYNLIHGLLDVWQRQNMGAGLGLMGAAYRKEAYEKIKQEMGFSDAAAVIILNQRKEDDFKKDQESKGLDYYTPEEREARDAKKEKRQAELAEEKDPKKRYDIEQKHKEEDDAEKAAKQAKIDETDLGKERVAKNAALGLSLNSIRDELNIAKLKTKQAKEGVDFGAEIEILEHQSDMMLNILDDNQSEKGFDLEGYNRDMQLLQSPESEINIAITEIIASHGHNEFGKMTERLDLTNCASEIGRAFYNEVINARDSDPKDYQFFSHLPGGKNIEHQKKYNTVVKLLKDENGNFMEVDQVFSSPSKQMEFMKTLTKVIGEGRELDQQMAEAEQERKKEAE